MPTSSKQLNAGDRGPRGSLFLFWLLLFSSHIYTPDLSLREMA